MPNYHNSVIYKIYDNTNGDVYYGSTCDVLKARINHHNRTGLNPNSKTPTKSKSIILNGNWNYSVVEKFPCETKQELQVRERWYIENNRCVNKQVPGRTVKEWREQNVNKQAVVHKEWRCINEERLAEYRKEYKIKTANKTCECGVVLECALNISKHRKTAKHRNLMALLNPCPPPS